MKLAKKLLQNIRHLIVTARRTVARGVDLVQVHTNFEIGRQIVEEEQRGRDRAAYGAEILQSLATRLSGEFGKGYSLSNLKSMRQFYMQYQNRIGQSLTGQLAGRKSQSLTGQLGVRRMGPSESGQFGILSTATARTALARMGPSATAPGSGDIPPRPFTLSWTHYVFLISIGDPDERSFYEIESTTEDWTVRELKRQFDSSLYERLALSRDKEGIRRLAREGQVVTTAQDVLKEPLVLEFLGLEERERYSESDLETAIIESIEHFLLELGKGFLFEERQRRFTFDGDHYFLDLVFYNRLLRCYVLIDLKLGRLTHKDLGQMQMYVNYFDRHEIISGERPTVGMVLCKQKNRALVEITLPDSANIHATEYRMYLPGKVELRKKLDEWSMAAEQALRGGASPNQKVRAPRSGVHGPSRSGRKTNKYRGLSGRGVQKTRKNRQKGT